MTTNNTDRDSLLEYEHNAYIDSLDTLGIPLWVYSVYYGIPSIYLSEGVEESPREKNPGDRESYEEPNDLPF